MISDLFVDVDNYFRNKTLSIRVSNETLDAETGIYQVSKSYSSRQFKGDVQPADNEKIYDDNGKLIEYNYRVYADKDTNIITMAKKPFAQIFYNQMHFSIEKFDEWDSYVLFYIKAVK